MDAALFDLIAERSKMNLLSMASRREVSRFGGFELNPASRGGSIYNTFTLRAAFSHKTGVGYFFILVSCLSIEPEYLRRPGNIIDD